MNEQEKNGSKEELAAVAMTSSDESVGALGSEVREQPEERKTRKKTLWVALAAIVLALALLIGAGVFFKDTVRNLLFGSDHAESFRLVDMTVFFNKKMLIPDVDDPYTKPFLYGDDYYVSLPSLERALDATLTYNATLLRLTLQDASVPFASTRLLGTKGASRHNSDSYRLIYPQFYLSEEPQRLLSADGAPVPVIETDGELYLPVLAVGRLFGYRTRISLADRTLYVGGEPEFELLVSTKVYNEIKPFVNGFASVRSGEKWGVIDQFDNVVLRTDYDNVGDFGNGVIPVQSGNVWIYLTPDAAPAWSTSYAYAEGFCGSTAVVADGNGLYGLIDDGGNQVLAYQYQDLIPTGNETFFANMHKKWYLIDRYGMMLLSDAYDSMALTEDGSYIVLEKDGKFGLASLNGEILVPCEYDAAGSGGDGYFLLQNRNLCEYLPIDDGNGFTVFCSDAKPFSDGLSAVKIGDLWGYIDQNGALKINAEWADAEPFCGGYARVEYPNGGYTYIDGSGNVAYDGIFDTAGSFSASYAVVSQKLYEGATVTTVLNTALEPVFEIAMEMVRPDDDFSDGYVLLYDPHTDTTAFLRIDMA